jgi:hypothetical protein
MPFEGAQVVVESRSARLACRELQSVTLQTRRSGKDGCFEFSSVEEGRYVIRVVGGEIAAPVSASLYVKDADVGGLLLKAQRGEWIVGTIVAPSAVGDNAEGMDLSEFVMGAISSGGSFSSSRVDADGRFRLGPLGPGAYCVDCLSGTAGWSVAGVKGVHPSKGALQLYVVEAARISGYVRNASRQGVEAQLSLAWSHADDGGRIRVGKSDANGRFELEVPTSWTGVIWARGLEGSASGSAACLAGDSDVVVEVGKGR